MKLINYLQIRGKLSNALTRAEAKILYIDYPLEKGWLDKFGEIEIPDEIIIKLTKAREQRYKKSSYLKYKKMYG